MSGSPLSVIGMSSSKVGLKKSKNLAKLVNCPLKEIVETIEVSEVNKDENIVPTGEVPTNLPLEEKFPIIPVATSGPESEEVNTEVPISKVPTLESKPELPPFKTAEDLIEESLVKIAEDNFKPVQVKKEIFTEETFKCLMDVDIKKILSAQLDPKLFDGLEQFSDYRKLPVTEMPFLPIYGTEILPESPMKTFESNSYSKNTSLLIGFTEDEGSLGLLLSGVIKKNNRLMANFNKDVASQILNKFANEYGLKNTQPIDIVKFYLNHINASDPEYRMYHLIRSFSDALGDSGISCPSTHFGSRFAGSGNCNNVHNYYISYKSKSPGIKEKAPWCSNDWMGSCHWTDLIFLFGLPFRTESYDKFCDLDRLMSEEMIKTWTDFARSGSKGILWPKVEVLNGRDIGNGKKSTTGSKVIPFVYEVNPLTPSCSKVKRSIKYDACDLLWNGEYE